MKPREPNWPIIATLAVIWGAVMVTSFCWLIRHAPGQPPQPGDIPAPVVTVKDSLTVAESGGLVASITCPDQVKAGSVLVLDTSGTSEGQTALSFVPPLPPGAVQRDTNGTTLYVWVAARGHYIAQWGVYAGGHSAATRAEFDVVGSDVPVDPPDGDDPPDEPDDPPDTAFDKWVKTETLKVEAENHREISATFRALAARIESGELRGSAAIQTATKTALFGEASTVNAEWGPWWNTVFPYLLNDLRLSSQEAWSEHFRAIAAVIDT